MIIFVQNILKRTSRLISADYICVMVVVACSSLVVEAMILRMYNYGDERKVPGWMRRCLLKETRKTTTSNSRHHDQSQVILTQISESQEKQRACTANSPSMGNGSRDLSSDVPQEPENPSNAETWKRIALSIESKVSILLMLIIIGNVVYSAMQIFTKSVTYS